MTEVTISAKENGPNIIIVDGKACGALCRCGGSNNKPFCDGTHAKAGFKAEAKQVNLVTADKKPEGVA